MWGRLPVRYHGRVQYAPGNRYQSQAKARFLPRGQESHLCVMTGQHVRPERAGAAAGILTTTQQFGAASGIAIVGAIFYSALGAAPARGTYVSGMVVAMSGHRRPPGRRLVAR